MYGQRRATAGEWVSPPPASGVRDIDRVSDIQRARLLSALVQACAEHGVANVTVAHIVERAGVSRRTFYELFSDSKDCFLAALDDGVAQIANRVVPAYEKPGRWRARIRAALAGLLSSLDEDPGMARLVVVETLGAGPEALERRTHVLDRVMDAVEEGRGEANARSAPTRLTAEGVVGGVLSVLHSRLLEGARGSYLELLNPLTSMVVQPYLGSAAARRELERPVPKAAPPLAQASNPLKDLGIRLTYRTVQVLMAVAADSGGSNRTIGARAGIADQGQISKLLSRLQRLGLIANTDQPATRGAPNAWALTDRGRELHRALAG